MVHLLTLHTALRNGKDQTVATLSKKNSELLPNSSNLNLLDCHVWGHWWNRRGPIRPWPPDGFRGPSPLARPQSVKVDRKQMREKIMTASRNGTNTDILVFGEYLAVYGCASMAAFRQLSTHIVPPRSNVREARLNTHGQKFDHESLYERI